METRRSEFIRLDWTYTLRGPDSLHERDVFLLLAPCLLYQVLREELVESVDGDVEEFLLPVEAVGRFGNDKQARGDLQLVEVPLPKSIAPELL